MVHRPARKNQKTFTRPSPPKTAAGQRISALGRRDSPPARTADLDGPGAGRYYSPVRSTGHKTRASQEFFNTTIRRARRDQLLPVGQRAPSCPAFGLGRSFRAQGLLPTTPIGTARACIANSAPAPRFGLQGWPPFPIGWWAPPRHGGCHMEWQEAAALQGFPHDYVFYGSPTDVWSMVGRAIQIQTGRAILKSIVRDWRRKRRAGG